MVENGSSHDVLGLVGQSGPVAQGVLLVLLFLSVISWAIIGRKIADLKRIRQESARFLKLFRSGAEVQEVYRASRLIRSSPLGGVFRAGSELIYGEGDGRGGWSGDREDLRRALDAAATEKVADVEKRLIFLATVGNVGPFIGLFGTVWGIMDAFLSIGGQGGASIAAVGPGIAEALVTTAAGLAAAVPSVVAYNYFLGRIESLHREVDSFTVELAATVPGGERP